MPRLYVFQLLTILTAQADAFQQIRRGPPIEILPQLRIATRRIDNRGIQGSTIPTYENESPVKVFLEDLRDSYGRNPRVTRSVGPFPRPRLDKRPGLQSGNWKSSPFLQTEESELRDLHVGITDPTKMRGANRFHPRFYPISGRAEETQDLLRPSDSEVIVPTSLFLDMYKNLQTLLGQFKTVSDLQRSADREIRGPFRLKAHNNNVRQRTPEENKSAGDPRLKGRPQQQDQKKKNSKGKSKKDNVDQTASQKACPNKVKQSQDKSFQLKDKEITASDEEESSGLPHEPSSHVSVHTNSEGNQQHQGDSTGNDKHQNQQNPWGDFQIHKQRFEGPDGSKTVVAINVKGDATYSDFNEAELKALREATKNPSQFFNSDDDEPF